MRLCFLILIVAVMAAEVSYAQDPKPGLMGSYASVTESECSIELSVDCSREGE